MLHQGAGHAEGTVHRDLQIDNLPLHGVGNRGTPASVTFNSHRHALAGAGGHFLNHAFIRRA